MDKNGEAGADVGNAGRKDYVPKEVMLMRQSHPALTLKNRETGLYFYNIR